MEDPPPHPPLPWGRVVELGSVINGATPSSSRRFWVFAFWMIFYVFQKKMGFGVFLVHPPMASTHGPHSWSRLMDPTRGPNLWTQLLDRNPKLDLWTCLVDPTCGHNSWTQLVHPTCEPDLWTQLVDSTLGALKTELFMDRQSVGGV